MNIDLEKFHWINGRNDNLNIILQSKYQIEMATEAIKLCDKKIRFFEKLEAEKAKRNPPKVEEPKSE